MSDTRRQDSVSQPPLVFVLDDNQRADLARRQQEVDNANKEWLERVSKENTPRGAHAREILEEISLEREGAVL